MHHGRFIHGFVLCPTDLPLRMHSPLPLGINWLPPPSAFFPAAAQHNFSKCSPSVRPSPSFRASLPPSLPPSSPLCALCQSGRPRSHAKEGRAQKTSLAGVDAALGSAAAAAAAAERRRQKVGRTEGRTTSSAARRPLSLSAPPARRPLRLRRRPHAFSPSRRRSRT